MTERKEILFVGFGGQGIKLLGTILGEAATSEGKVVATSASYGAEARGSRCRSEVVISEKEIDYPRMLSPDFLVALSQDGYDFAQKLLSSEAVIFYDPTMVTPQSHLERSRKVKLKKDSSYLHYPIPATKIATTLGNRIVANIVMLGAFVGKTKIVKPESVIKIIEKKLKKEFLDLNLKAFEKGTQALQNL